MPILLVSTASRWLGTARIPRWLAKAGFQVCLLGPRDSLAVKSRYVSRIAYLQDNASPLQWIEAFAGTVKATNPRIVLPCDDTSFRLLAALVLTPPEGMQPTLLLQLSALIRNSLGDPAHYRDSVDKTLLPAAAAALGVRVPSSTVVASLSEAEAFAADQGYPVVLKRRHGFAGRGVGCCADRGELAAAWAEVRHSDPLGLEGQVGLRVLCQAYVPGANWLDGVAAWNGEVLAGATREKIVRHPPRTGPSTVMRYLRVPAIRDFSEKLVRGFGMSGLFGVEYVIRERTGDAYLIEINRRLTTGTYASGLVGVDLCAALFGALNGTPTTSRRGLDEGEEYVLAHFPQEWLRDPDSAYLRDCRVDAPWDEPELLDAMLALRHEH